MHKGLTTALAAAAIALAAAAPAGAELLPVDTGDGGAEIEATLCGPGVLNECGSTTARRCTQWVTTSGSGTISIVPGVGTVGGSISGSGTLTCGAWTETTTKIYKDRYKTKTA